MLREGEFSLAALYEAMDERRRERGLSWAGVMREMNAMTAADRRHEMSASTVTRTRTGALAEGDGVLQMLRWLGRSPESFLPGAVQVDETAARLPESDGPRTLRFDTRKLHAALSERRVERGITWAQAAEEIGTSASMLTNLAKGVRTYFPQVMRMVGWLGRLAAEFTRWA